MLQSVGNVISSSRTQVILRLSTVSVFVPIAFSRSYSIFLHEVRKRAAVRMNVEKPGFVKIFNGGG